MSTNARLNIIDSSPTPVLGQTLKAGSCKPPTPSRNGFLSFRKNIKIPKVPRPTRTLLMFTSLKKGVRELIEATKEDLRELTENTDFTDTKTQAKLLSAADKKIKSVERHLKRLDFHLSKIEELHDIYALHEQLREGAKTMVQAYTINPSRTKDSLTNVRCGYKECVQTMCTIEAQLECLMGTFHCNVQGMVGFARLCIGDVFEVVLRYGTQKWKTRGKVEKDGSQKWESKEITFKALIGDIINVKAVEQRSFKSLVLGLKNCETKDLFSPNPQLMTISINPNGSLKFSIIVTWNPFDGFDDTLTLFDPSVNPVLIPRKRPVSLLNLNSRSDYSLQTTLNTAENRKSMMVIPTNTFDSNDNPKHSINKLKQKTTSLDNLHLNHDHPPRPARPPKTGITALAYSKRHSTPSKTVLRKSSPNSLELIPDKVDLPQTRTTDAILMNSSRCRTEVATLDQAVTSLLMSLEDIHGQYVEVVKLEEMAAVVQKMIRRPSSRSSSISISIESALGAFDFLNGEDSSCHKTDSTSWNIGNLLSNPKSTAKTTDSGIESLTKRLSEDGQLDSSMGSLSEAASTGNDQVDVALTIHFVYCDKLIQGLGTYGPLKCRELYSLHKLEKQADMIEHMINVAKLGSTLDLYTVLNEVTKDKQLREFWTRAVNHQVLFVQPERLATTLEQKLGAKIRDKYPGVINKVFDQLIANILDLAAFDQDKPSPQSLITLYQFIGYFEDEGGLEMVSTLASDVWMCDRLRYKDTHTIVKTLSNLNKEVVSATCLKVIITLLNAEKADIRDAAKRYVMSLKDRDVYKEKCIVVFVEALEENDENVRCGACIALSLLQIHTCIDRLVFLCQTDSSSVVRCKAKEALNAMGEDGQSAYLDSQLTTHGFQGLRLTKRWDWLN